MPELDEKQDDLKDEENKKRIKLKLAKFKYQPLTQEPPRIPEEMPNPLHSDPPDVPEERVHNLPLHVHEGQAARGVGCVHHLPLQVREGQAGTPPPVVVRDEHRFSTLEEASETRVEYKTLSSLKFCAGI